MRLLLEVEAYYHKHRYAVLFFSLLVSLVAVPLFSTLKIPTGILEVFLVANVVAAVIPISSPKKRHLLLGVLVLSVATQLGGGLYQVDELTKGGAAILIAVALMAAVSAFRFTVNSRAVGAEQIHAALSAYMIAGIFVGHIYFLAERLWPGSIVYPTTQDQFTMESAIYFSFITLATLGYGDIVPRSELMRGVAIVEAVGGQFYLAVMVAGLVSLYATTRDTKRPDN